jgi:hypothetical protein
VPGASLVRFVALAALIASIALGLWLLDAGRGWTVVGIVVAWLVASFVEWIAWSRVEAPWRLADAHGGRPGYPRAMPPPASPRPALVPDAPESEPHSPPTSAGPAPKRDPASSAQEPPSVSAVPVGRARASAPPEPEREGSKEHTFRLFGVRVTLRAGRQEKAPRLQPAAPSPVGSATTVAASEPIVTPEVSVARPRPAPDPRRKREPDPEAEPVRGPVDDRPRQEPEPAPSHPLPDPVAVEKERSVVRLDDRQTGESRRWNLWELERAARERPDVSAQETEARSLLLHLRQFAAPDGLLPAEFDGLVRESFAALVGELEQA